MTLARTVAIVLLTVASLMRAEAAAAPIDAPAVHQAQIEARIPFPPQPVVGSDRQRHVAYEMRLTSFQDEDNPLKLMRVAVFAGTDTKPLAVVEGAELYDLLNRPAPDPVPRDGVPIQSGRTLTLFVWLTLPPKAHPLNLRHQISLQTAKGELQRADDVHVAIDRTSPVRISAPLRGGRWLAVEGPGNALSHHWGSLVAVDGTLSIPQRFAIDWFGLDEANHSLRSRHENLATSVDEDWVGYGQEVLAVADGVVVDARDGVLDGKPLTPLEGPDDLTARTLYGNFVILKISPGVYAHYAHLRSGSLKVRAGQRVQRGTPIAQLGQTGSAGAPHLHFHLSDRPTFEHSQGLPFVIDAFTLHGRSTVEATFDPATPTPLSEDGAGPRRQQLPLDGSVVSFPNAR
ncbi:M23 family metallopeptidase [Burkholderiaceae bacterium UC74_6]